MKHASRDRLQSEAAIEPRQFVSVFAELIKHLSATMAAHGTPIQNVSLPNAIKAIKKALAPMQEMQLRLQPEFRRLEEAFHGLPKDECKHLEIMGQNGWYLDPEMTYASIACVAEAYAEGRHEDAQNALCSFYRERLASTEEALKKSHPRRAAILTHAFAAHRDGAYALSIPVFLAQADGICQEKVGVQLFKRENNMPVVAAMVREVMTDSINDIIFHQLTVPLPISANATERKQSSPPLNRHAVLHGEALDYDTEPNSYRSISLLRYVSWAVEDFKKPSPTEEAAQKLPHPKPKTMRLRADVEKRVKGIHSIGKSTGWRSKE